MITPQRIQDILNTIRDPRTRWHEVPGGGMLLNLFLQNPHDPHVLEMLTMRLRQQCAKYQNSLDPFWGNYPPKGALPFHPGCVPVLLPTSNIFTLNTLEFDCTCGLFAPPGLGKTTAIRSILIALLDIDNGAVCLVFERKTLGEALNAQFFWDNDLPVYVWKAEEVPLAPFEPIDGTTPLKHAAQMVSVLAQYLNLFFSQKELLETVEILLKKGLPTWHDVAVALKAKKCESFSQRDKVHNAALAMKEADICIGECLNARSNGVLNKILTTPGCHVISLQDMSESMAALYSAIPLFYIFHRRRLLPHERTRRICVIFDDCLKLVEKKKEELGFTNYHIEVARLGRSFGIMPVYSTQNREQVDPMIVANMRTQIVFASHGRNAELHARDLHLTRDQAAVLPLLDRGEAIILQPATWPLPVRGRFPRI